MGEYSIIESPAQDGKDVFVQLVTRTGSLGLDHPAIRLTRIVRAPSLWARLWGGTLAHRVKWARWKIEVDWLTRLGRSSRED